MSTTRERPILFSGPMVRAILEGRKTQTRRVVQPQPKVLHAIHNDASITTERIFRRGDGRIHCPYGAPGDRLWVRETWAVRRDRDYVKPRDLDPSYDLPWYLANGERPSGCAGGMGKARPGMFMPRWASRITLEVTTVRVQRLQEISEEDAAAEGVAGYVHGHGPVTAGELAVEPGYWHPRFYRAGFEHLWDEINGKRGPWESNPWVWAITFRRVKP